jgi:hypothetical protein
MPHSSIDLSRVTLCSISSVHIKATLRAMAISQKSCHFGDSLLFTDHRLKTNLAQIVPIDPVTSYRDYSYLILKKILPYIQTDLILLIQWDGYVLNPEIWQNSFLNYDYIGAKWTLLKDNQPHYYVGNGGFSLRSKRLLEITSSDEFSFNDTLNEDSQICLEKRQWLEDNKGIIFSDVTTADQFSYESSPPDHPTFGFHGFSHMHLFSEDQDIINIMNDCEPYFYKTPAPFLMMYKYFYLDNEDMAYFIYKKISQYFCDDDIFSNLKYIHRFEPKDSYPYPYSEDMAHALSKLCIFRAKSDISDSLNGD